MHSSKRKVKWPAQFTHLFSPLHWPVPPPYSQIWAPLLMYEVVGRISTHVFQLHIFRLLHCTRSKMHHPCRIMAETAPLQARWRHRVPISSRENSSIITMRRITLHIYDRAAKMTSSLPTMISLWVRYFLNI